MNWRVSKSTVATLMAETGVVARRKRRRRGTATPDKSARKAPDGLRRDFTPDAAAGRALCGVHRNPHRRRQTPLATVLDLYSRRSYRYPTLDRALCPAHASVDPSAGHPPSSLRIQWSTLVVSTADEVRFGAHYGFGRWVRGGWVSVCRGAD
jgi:transposase InsO family protein